MTDYYDLVPLDLYDKTIVGHPYVDACNASILFYLLKFLGQRIEGRKVLDVGAGTGQVARLLKGIPNLEVFAQDYTSESEEYFRNHPELADIPFYISDATVDPFAHHFDAMICRGVLHHIPQSKRINFLNNMMRHSDIVIIADEAVADYQTEEERIENCGVWYEFVIQESRRRGLHELADVEEEFYKLDISPSHEDEMDFKEDLQHIEKEVIEAGGEVNDKYLYGPWGTHKGGFYTITISLK